MNALPDLSSKDKFLEDFSTMSGAAIGVVAVRTREPYRMLENLRQHADAKRWQFDVWKCTTGWNRYNMDDIEADPTADGETSEVGSISKIGENTPPPQGMKGFVYAMLWPHWFCSRNDATPAVVQYLADYSRSFSEQLKRLVIIVPPEYQLPVELEDCVVVLDTDLPTQDELREVYDDTVGYIESKNKTVDYDEDEEVPRILAAGAGMTVTEFENTLSRAVRTFRKELPDVPIDDFVTLISKTKSEIIKRSEVLELMPLGNMDEVGGLENLKAWIKVRRHAYEPEAEDFGVEKPKGAALIGPPGTGKSLCAKAIAHELGLPLIRFDVSSVFNQFVGSSESRVREALKMCGAMAPCVVMLDEVDKAFDMNSSGGDSGVGKRVLGAVLTYMQESGKDIFWVMTANRVGGLPPEMLRKGRLDEVFSVTIPGDTERRDILNIHLKKRRQDPAKIKGLDTVIEASRGFVGAEIEAAVKEAVLLAYAEDKPVSAELLIAQFQNVKPLSEAHAEQFTAMRDWAENNARPASKEKPPSTPRERSRKAAIPQAETLGKRKRKFDTDLDG